MKAHKCGGHGMVDRCLCEAMFRREMKNFGCSPLSLITQLNWLITFSKEGQIADRRDFRYSWAYSSGGIGCPTRIPT